MSPDRPKAVQESGDESIDDQSDMKVGRAIPMKRRRVLLGHYRVFPRELAALEGILGYFSAFLDAHHELSKGCPKTTWSGDPPFDMGLNAAALQPKAQQKALRLMPRAIRSANALRPRLTKITSVLSEQIDQLHRSLQDLYSLLLGSLHVAKTGREIEVELEEILNVLSLYLAAECPSVPDGGRQTRAQSFTPGQVAEMAEVDTATVNKYAKLAKVPTPGPGKRNHPYAMEHVIAILNHMAKSNDSKIAKTAEDALQNLDAKSKSNREIE